MLQADTFTTRSLLTLTVEHADANQVFRRFVKRDGTRAGAAEQAIGVSRIRSATQGEDLPVDIAGLVLVEAGAAIPVDAYVEPDAMGRAVTFVPPTIRHAVVAGASANTNIAVAGTELGDTLDAVVATDATAVAGPTIHADGQIRSTNSTTGKNLLVVWRKPPRSAAGRAMLPAAAAGDTVPVLLGVTD